MGPASRAYSFRQLGLLPNFAGWSTLTHRVGGGARASSAAMWLEGGGREEEAHVLALVGARVERVSAGGSALCASCLKRGSAAGQWGSAQPVSALAVIALI